MWRLSSGVRQLAVSWIGASCGCGAASAMTQTSVRRWQSQSSRGQPGLHWDEGVVDPRYSSEGNMRRFNPDTVAHYVKATIQNDRREMGLGEVYDWHEFAKDAVYIPTRSGPLWVGSDDPRCAKFMRRREKMKKSPQQKARPKPGQTPRSSWRTTHCVSSLRRRPICGIRLVRRIICTAQGSSVSMISSTWRQKFSTCHVHRLCPLWATWITARRRCWITSAKQMWPPRKRVALRRMLVLSK
ncbi:hypothetical protein TCDM_02625 [Trypanosoma cruzi Dm28c]|uniref:Uncharacterized protein n=2 Tax=Trypanosoma cruzi TaxID=5693 RepID=V5BVX1_TRYCR|nr:hypothetical protein TCDM_02625 [Trypanosoma cruzi Dm28c]PWU90592.1 putative translation initiation factor IF-2 [Trypanosoma cruzi]